MLEIRPGFEIPENELSWSFSRSGGPGGQNVNKVATRVTLRLRILGNPALPERFRGLLERRLAKRLTRDGELLLHVDETRDQARNREIARTRLAELLRDATRVLPPRRPTKPTRASVRRRLQAKRGQGEKKRLRRPPRGD